MWIRVQVRTGLNIMTMECSSEIVVECAYKRELAGPNEIQNGGQIQNDYKLLALQASDIMHSQNDYIPGITVEYNA